MPRTRAKERRTTTGTISTALLRKVAILAGHLGMKKHKVLDVFGGPGIDAELRRVMRQSRSELRNGV